MDIRGIYSQDVVTASPRDTLFQAARRMERLDVSCLPVLEDDRLVGVITERDFTRAAGSGVPPDAATVAEHMTRRPFTASPDEDAVDVARKMLRLGVRHLPIVERGEVVGIISARDLLAHHVEASG